MSLSCECEYNDEPEWIWYKPNNYSIFNSDVIEPCNSCGTDIITGDTCTKFRVFDCTEDGDDEETASRYMCEECSDIYFSLDELGFCIGLGDDMHDLLADYHELYGVANKEVI